MRALNRAFLRIWGALTGRSAEADLRREIDSHIAEATDDFIRQGLKPAEARRAALRHFGGVAQTEEAYRDALVVRWVDAFGRHVRHASRALGRSPGFALVLVGILAIGIGALAAVFTLLNRVVLQPLPYVAADRLVAVRHAATGLQLSDVGVSEGLLIHYRQHSQTLEAIGTYEQGAMLNLATPDGSVERVRITRASSALFGLLGEAPLHGRLFTEEDGRPGFMDGRWPIPVLLSHGLWRDRFNADPAVVGTMVTINELPRLVVGVMPEGFSFPDRHTQIWMLNEVPLQNASVARSFDLNAVARLRQGTTIDTAERELAELVSRIEGAFRDATPARLAEVGLVPFVRPLKEQVVGDIANVLWPLSGGMLLLLGIAVANAATLFSIRAQQRRREVSVRLALGASRHQVAAAFFLEALLLTMTGAAVGLYGAQAALATVLRMAPIELPRSSEVGLGVIEVLVALSLSVAIAGFYAVLSTRRADGPAHDALRGGDRTTTSPGGQRGFDVLLGTQVALALVLMVFSALASRTYTNLTQRPLGFAPERILTVEIGLPFQLASQHIRLYTDLVDRVRRLPGVESAAAASGLPLTGTDERHLVSGSPAPVSMTFFVPGYFQTIGTPIAAGHGFSDRAAAPGSLPVLVSASLERRLFGAHSAIGQPLERLERDGSPIQTFLPTGPSARPPFTIVGVVGDVRGTSLREGPAEVLYVPLVEPRVEPQIVPTDMTLVVRAAGAPLGLISAVRDAVREANPRLSVGKVQEFESIVRSARAEEAFAGALLGSAALVAFALGLIGVHGSVAQQVRRRRQEIGVRVALGASRSSIVRLVTTAALAAVGAGATVGIAAALVGAQLLDALLYGVEPRDPSTIALVCALLVASAALAAFTASLRGTRVSPVNALRGE